MYIPGKLKFMESKQLQQTLATVGEAIGKGILAGIAGTAAMTISQMIEMQITKRSMSDAPTKVAGQVLGVEPSAKTQEQLKNEEEGESKQVKEEHAERFNQITHWGYGTGWGIVCGLFSAAGMSCWPATIAHFGAVWGTAQVMLPAANASSPIYEWSPKQIAIDVLHHGVYALAAGFAYDYIDKGSRTEDLK